MGIRGNAKHHNNTTEREREWRKKGKTRNRLDSRLPSLPVLLGETPKLVVHALKGRWKEEDC